jgi:hypothetical protein
VTQMCLLVVRNLSKHFPNQFPILCLESRNAEGVLQIILGEGPFQFQCFVKENSVLALLFQTANCFLISPSVGHAAMSVLLWGAMGRHF